MIRSLLPILVVLFALLAGASPAEAGRFRITLTEVREYSCSPGVPCVDVAGTYRRANRNQRVIAARVEALDENFRVVSSSSLRLQRRLKRFSGGVGDFRMRYYRVVFYIEGPRKGRFEKRTQIFRWNP